MDKALKQRLVGASVLIILAIIVLPMLLSGRPESGQDSRSIELPPKPAELSFETRRFPIGTQQADDGPSEVPVRSAPELGEPRGSIAVAQPPAAADNQVAAEVAPVEESTTGADAGAATATASGRYLVQVGSFSSTGNANRLAARLREGGLPVLLDTVVTAAGRLHRVRVGPFDFESAAEDAVAEIRARIPDLKDLNPRVLDLRPEEGAPVTEPSDPLVRWVVQAGSFAAEENARALIATLRDNGFAAYAATVSDGAGITYKVRVGPVIERQSAVELAARLRQELSIDGLVMSVD
jgi:DedD protein